MHEVERGHPAGDYKTRFLSKKESKDNSILLKESDKHGSA